MKKIGLKNSHWQSILSLLALAVFVLLATGTIPGTSQQKKKLADGRWELSRNLASGEVETTIGNVDNRGRFEGPVKITYENDDYIVTHTEEVNMKAGQRHGLSKIIYPNGSWSTACYQYGKRVDDAYCEGEEKSAISPLEDNSAYAVFMYEVPWFAFKLDALGFDSTYLKSFLDTLEVVLYATEFTEVEFDDYYDNAISVLEETPYDSLIQMNAVLSLYNGLDLILNHEFRLATLDSYAEGDSNTYAVVENIYPNYLLYLSMAGVTDADFEGFCTLYDSIMSSYDPVTIDDPYLIDSLDERMYRTLEFIYSIEENTAVKSRDLQNALLSKDFSTIRTLEPEYYLPVRKQALDYTPQEVSEIVLFTILENFLYGDLIKNAVKQAYTINKGIVALPSVVTDFSGYNSSTSVTIYGNVIEDGGGEVTSRGIVWGTIYNPTMSDQIISAGNGTGDFVATLTDLSEGETYYVRAFATNSAGTAYGNCISFVAESTIGIVISSMDKLDLKIFPNPAENDITLTFKTVEAERIVIIMFDLNGRIVLQEELVNVVPGRNSVNMNISNLENGVYTCQIRGEQHVRANQKLIINR